MKRSCVMLLIPLVIFFLSVCIGCSKKKDDGKGYVFGYGIEKNPGSLDPQCADDEQSFMLIELIYEGLLRIDADGNIVTAGAESYTVSEDGLVYTFLLRSDSYWTDKNGYEAKCTANDYVFAFKRLFSPETRAAHAAEYFAIKNSKAINSGAVSDMSQLGVYAKDDRTLVIELEYEDPMFLSLLTEAAAKPCSEDYFVKAQGKYGLFEEATASNGAFYLKTWNYDKWSDDNNVIVLRFSEKYSEYDEVYPLGLNFFIEDSEAQLADFENGTIQNLVMSGNSSKKYPTGEYDREEFSVNSIGLIFNTKSSVFSDENLRLALVYSIERSEIIQSFGYETAYGIVPEFVSLAGEKYRAKTGNSVNVKCDIGKAASFYKKAVETADKEALGSIRIIAIQGKDDDMLSAMQSVTQMWQKQLGFFCNITFLDEDDYCDALKNGKYEIALADISASKNHPYAYLSRFADGTFAYTLPPEGFDKLLSDCISLSDINERFSACKAAERALIQSGTYIPLSYGKTYFIGAKDCDNVIYDPIRKTIDYRKALYYE